MPQTICLFKDYQQEPNILQFEESFHLRWVLLHLRGHPIQSTLFHLYYCWNVPHGIQVVAANVRTTHFGV